MKKYILLIFILLAVGSYTGSSAFGMANNAVTAGLGDEEFVNINSATSDNLKITYSFKTTKTLKVYNMLGKCILTARLASGTATVDVPTALERGTYIYSVEEGGKTFGAKKFIVK